MSQAAPSSTFALKSPEFGSYAPTADIPLAAGAYAQKRTISTGTETGPTASGPELECYLVDGLGLVGTTKRIAG